MYKCEKCGARLTEDEVAHLYGDVYEHCYQRDVDDFETCGPVFSEIDDELNQNPG